MERNSCNIFDNQKVFSCTIFFSGSRKVGVGFSAGLPIGMIARGLTSGGAFIALAADSSSKDPIQQVPYLSAYAVRRMFCTAAAVS